MYFNTSTFGNKVYNNILSKLGSGDAMYLSSPLAVSEMDYNAYHIDSSAGGGLSYTQGYGFDTNSYYVSTPIYANLDSLYTCSTELPARGTYIMNVPKDFDGKDRFVGGPTVGPHEYLAPGSPVLGDDFLLCGSGPVEYVIPIVNGASYLWSTGDTTNTLSVTAPGTYSITVSGLACGSGELQDDVVIGNASSIADYSSERFWKTVKFTNQSTNGVAYMWDFGDGQTSTEENPIHLYDQNGNYNVCLTTYGDCDTITTCDSIFAHNALGVNGVSGDSEVSIYPNPAKDEISIEAKGIEGNMLSIEITNVTGQVVLSSQVTNFNGSIKRFDVSDLNKGVYLIKVFTSTSSNIQRLIIE
jgi:PKD repeat protein